MFLFFYGCDKQKREDKMIRNAMQKPRKKKITSKHIISVFKGKKGTIE